MYDYLGTEGTEGAEQFLSDWDEGRSSTSSLLSSSPPPPLPPPPTPPSLSARPFVATHGDGHDHGHGGGRGEEEEEDGGDAGGALGWAIAPPPKVRSPSPSTALPLPENESSRGGGGPTPSSSGPVGRRRHAGGPEKGQEGLPAVALAARRLDDPALERWASSMMALGRAARVGEGEGQGAGGGGGRAHAVVGWGRDPSFATAPATARPCPSSKGSGSRDSSPRRRHRSSGMLALPHGGRRSGGTREDEHEHQGHRRRRLRQRQEWAPRATINGGAPPSPGGQAREEGAGDGGGAPGGAPAEEVVDHAPGGLAAMTTGAGEISMPVMSPRRRRGSAQGASFDDEDGWASAGSSGGGSGGSGGGSGGVSGGGGEGGALLGAGVPGVDGVAGGTERDRDGGCHPKGKQVGTGESNVHVAVGAETPPAAAGAAHASIAAAAAAESRKAETPPGCSLFDLADQNIDDI